MQSSQPLLSSPAAPAPFEAARVRNGAVALLDTLIACGVDTLFGYPGGAALPLYDALHGEPRLRHVLVRHEQSGSVPSSSRNGAIGSR